MARLPAITIAEPSDLPKDVLALLDHRLLDLGGTQGDPQAGDTIQYAELRIVHVSVRNRPLMAAGSALPGRLAS